MGQQTQHSLPRRSQSQTKLSIVLHSDDSLSELEKLELVMVQIICLPLTWLSYLAKALSPIKPIFPIISG